MSGRFEQVVVVVEGVLATTAIGFLLVRSRGVTATLAWVFAILAFPIVGALAYFALANPFVDRPRRRLRGRRPALALGAAAPLADPVPAACVSVLRAAWRSTGFAPTPGNRVEVVARAADAFARVESAILGARRRVWAEYYIVHPDPTGARFLELLTRRAGEGLDVRLLVDAVGSWDIDAAAVERLVAAGGQVATFLPVNPLRRRWAVHLRNHRKLLVVDGEVALLGGANIGDAYAGRLTAAQGAWRDLLAIVHGPAARDLGRVFAEDWTFASGSPLEPDPAPGPAGDAAVGVLPSGPDQEENATAVAWFAAIGLALDRCWLTTPYLVPDEATLRALTVAARRGVDVRLMVPPGSDVALMRLVNRSYYPPLLAAGVRIFEARGPMLHAKTLVVDGALSLVGSANVDRRSFRLNFELGVLVADAVLARDLEARFVEDVAHSVEVTAGSVGRRTLGRRLVEGAAQLLSPLL